QKLEEVPNDWDAALDLFQEKTNESIFDPQLIDNFIRTKQQEKRVFEDLDATQQTAVYLSAL
ncbi:MAG: glutamine synthetase, partial [Boseongicola sp.]|nr:glutamine synthetase [Boseongicola sp.]